MLSSEVSFGASATIYLLMLTRTRLKILPQRAPSRLAADADRSQRVRTRDSDNGAGRRTQGAIRQTLRLDAWRAWWSVSAGHVP